jgi:photosystem I subunit 3
MKLNIKSIFSKIIILTIFSGFFLNIDPQVANANFSALTPCKESAPFQKRLKSSVKKLENRLKLYTPESKEAKSLIKQVESTKARFAKYENSSLLCGKEGLPRIIATGQWDHANEFIIPGLLFLYITGWIGWVGRKYVRYASTTSNAFENEIIINVPIALSIMNSGFLWPVDAWKEFATGDLLASDDDVTVSPR